MFDGLIFSDQTVSRRSHKSNYKQTDKVVLVIYDTLSIKQLWSLLSQMRTFALHILIVHFSLGGALCKIQSVYNVTVCKVANIVTYSYIHVGGLVIGTCCQYLLMLSVHDTYCYDYFICFYMCKVTFTVHSLHIICLLAIGPYRYTCFFCKKYHVPR